MGSVEQTSTSTAGRHTSAGAQQRSAPFSLRRWAGMSWQSDRESQSVVVMFEHSVASSAGGPHAVKSTCTTTAARAKRMTLMTPRSSKGADVVKSVATVSPVADLPVGTRFAVSIPAIVAPLAIATNDGRVSRAIVGNLARTGRPRLVWTANGHRSEQEKQGHQRKS